MQRVIVLRLKNEVVVALLLTRGFRRRTFLPFLASFFLSLLHFFLIFSLMDSKAQKIWFPVFQLLNWKIILWSEWAHAFEQTNEQNQKHHQEKWSIMTTECHAVYPEQCVFTSHCALQLLWIEETLTVLKYVIYSDHMQQRSHRKFRLF